MVLMKPLGAPHEGRRSMLFLFWEEYAIICVWYWRLFEDRIKPPQDDKENLAIPSLRYIREASYCHIHTHNHQQQQKHWGHYRKPLRDGRRRRSIILEALENVLASPTAASPTSEGPPKCKRVWKELLQLALTCNWHPRVSGCVDVSQSRGGGCHRG